MFSLHWLSMQKWLRSSHRKSNSLLSNWKTWRLIPWQIAKIMIILHLMMLKISKKWDVKKQTDQSPWFLNNKAFPLMKTGNNRNRSKTTRLLLRQDPRNSGLHIIQIKNHHWHSTLLQASTSMRCLMLSGCLKHRLSCDLINYFSFLF